MTITEGQQSLPKGVRITPASTRPWWDAREIAFEKKRVSTVIANGFWGLLWGGMGGLSFLWFFSNLSDKGINIIGLLILGASLVLLGLAGLAILSAVNGLRGVPAFAIKDDAFHVNNATGFLAMIFLRGKNANIVPLSQIQNVRLTDRPKEDQYDMPHREISFQRQATDNANTWLNLDLSAHEAQAPVNVIRQVLNYRVRLAHGETPKPPAV